MQGPLSKSPSGGDPWPTALRPGRFRQTYLLSTDDGYNLALGNLFGGISGNETLSLARNWRSRQTSLAEIMFDLCRARLRLRFSIAAQFGCELKMSAQICSHPICLLLRVLQPYHFNCNHTVAPGFKLYRDTQAI